MSDISNNYLEALQVAFGLYAVKLSDGGWSVADGPGTALSEPDEIELAGCHLPIKFKSMDTTKEAILSGPHEWFDIATNSSWTKHCLELGASAEANYLMDINQ